jgi:hypothetical protein
MRETELKVYSIFAFEFSDCSLIADCFFDLIEALIFETVLKAVNHAYRL